MFTGNYELVIVWDGGENSVYEYETREKAEEAEAGMRTALGNQIAWSCVRRQTVK